jgi:hypothetical protein
MIESTCPRCGVVHLAPVPVTQFACCPNDSPVVVDVSLKQTIRRTASRSFVENRADRPGDEVYRLIKKHFGVDPPPGCRCQAVKSRMNQLGWERCLELIDELEVALADNAKEFSWSVTIASATRAVLTGALAWLHPLQPWRSLIVEGCRRAREAVENADS